jgi:hypothetical protein
MPKMWSTSPGARRAYVAVACAVSLVACGLEPSGTLARTLGAAPDAGPAVSSHGSADAHDDAPLEDAAAAGDADDHAIDAGSDDAPITPALCDGGTSPRSPSPIALAAPMSTSLAYGGMGGQAFDDTCPNGMALVGIVIVAAQGSPFSMTHVQGVCAPVRVDPCAVVVGTPVDLPDHGQAPGAPVSLKCPADNVVVGVHVSSGIFIDAITLDCAPLVIGGSGFAHGPITSVGPAGGSGGTPNAPYECPGLMVARELAGSAGGFIDQLRLGCATPIVPVGVP